jgi:hypothetical protein
MCTCWFSMEMFWWNLLYERVSDQRFRKLSHLICYVRDSLKRKTIKQNPLFFQEMKKAVFGGNELRNPVMSRTKSEVRRIKFHGELFQCLLWREQSKWNSAVEKIKLLEPHSHFPFALYTFVQLCTLKYFRVSTFV